MAIAVLWLGAAPSRAATPPAVSTGTAVAKSTTTTPADIYTVEKLRDPFMEAASGGAAATNKPFNVKEDFNIHNLALRGLMRDPSGEIAMFRDAGFGIVFVLRKGRLFDMKDRPVSGVSGSVNLKQKSAHLMTQDGDVQTFRLGQNVDE